jgi:hypothetical protein
MIKAIILRVASKYSVKPIFSTDHDNMWKYEKQVASLSEFKSFLDKLNCEKDIAEAFMGIKLDSTIRGKFNPDCLVIEWREV